MNTVPETLYTEAKMLDKGLMPMPRMAILYPTYKCNQRCYYCFYKDWNNKDVVEDSTKMIDVLKQLKDMDVQAVEWCGGGDPTCAPNIVDLINKANELGFKQGMLTNGVNFKDEIMKAFIKKGVYVRFSFETVNPILYKKVRGTDDCVNVQKNIEAALKYRKEINSQCQISIKVGLSDNIGEREIADVFSHFDGSGIDNIQVKNLWNPKGIHYRKDINKIELVRLADGQSIPIVKKVMYPKFMSEQCWISPIQVTIDVYGDAYLCCYYNYRKQSHRICNVFEKPLKEVWGTKQHRSVIANVKISECLCHDCRFQKYMRVIRKIQNKGHWEFV